MASSRGKPRRRSRGGMIFAGIGLGALFWFLESTIHVFVFREGTLLGQLFTPSPHEIWMRLLAVGLFALSGAYVQIMLSERRRREEEIRRRNEELAALNTIAATVSQSLNLDQILYDALDAVLQLDLFEDQAKGTVFLLDERAGELLLGAQRGTLKGFPCVVKPLQMGECLCGLAALRSEVIVSNDCWQDQRHSCRCPGMPPHKDICLPLRVRGKVLGVLEVWLPVGQEISAGAIELLISVSEQVGLAIENAGLYANLQRQMEQLKKTQAQLVQSAKLAAVGELAAGVAHELNNPLTSVLGFAELLMEDIDPDASHQESLRTIFSEAQRARQIVRGLLDFSRQTKPERQLADVNHILRQTLAVVRYHLESSGVVIEENYASDIGFVFLDEGQMKQVFLNLISNAVQAIPEEGKLSLRTARIGDEVAVSITDNGVGIPSEIQERIFDPFFTTRPSGTGLGLSVSLGIVQEHGGRITVRSQTGRGSTFTVWLPVEITAGEMEYLSGSADSGLGR